ncbi:probable retinol dehydrogenase 14 [Rhynchosporium agropyri]|uniref:Probable retinol dehydrogenase 14 n=2 Tax=Rhynchosporium TaxID=38037 RepID=A0A1E1KMV6_9HELO|nr:probable retinol dehydrogenase 14 [Rhynchosporium commune]CZS99355.1 probable retinol dehydrogenase 14 [Rhynchosporium agropyri]
MSGVVNTVRNTIVENLGGTHGIAAKANQFALADVPDQSQKVAVISGGSRGIGYACAHTLLQKNIEKLYVIGSTQESIDGASSDIESTLGASTLAKVKFFQADLGDWKSIPGIVKQITDSTDRLDILINCAARGIMTYQLTEYGVDRHMAVNHMGHVIFTSHLLPLIKSTAKKHPEEKVRIVTFGSNAHQGAPGDTKFANLEELNQDYGPNGQYGRSKLAQMLYAKYLYNHLKDKYPNILANTVHPGFVETKQSVEDIHEPYPILGYGMSVGMKPFKKSQWEGAVPAMFCATKTEQGGQYVCPPAIPEAGSSQFQDESGELTENLMRLTLELVGEKVDPKSQGCPMQLY